ncbi:hypothetical protein BDY21DRAFT_334665 [Lineolata rhizophorae]|uniref:Heterokaryon incompatibility domain-containing protein n=1 Tax=Lineolata rhizophorae TaxID=578093 RepID=A0A6A6PCR2_9PEZI|nr:hypothetical protein BDY21DRAFT_334665 [Lineolata rhizophorae]
MAWDELAVAAIIIQRIKMFEGFELAGTGGVSAIEEMRVQSRDNEEHGLLEYLRSTRHYRATDPRDRVYALLGVVHPEDAAAMRPDYSIDPKELYKRVALYLIEDRKSLDVLGYVGFRGTLHGLPSWIPDWSAVVPEEYMALADVSHGAYWLDQHKHPPVIDEIGYNSLVLEGKRIDAVMITGKEMGTSPIGHDNSEASLSVYKDWESLALSLDCYPANPDGDDVINAYWKTLIAGATENNEEVDADYGRHFINWYAKFGAGLLDTSGVPRIDSEVTNEEGVLIYGGCVFDATVGRRLALTNKGFLGLFPAGSKDGDVIVLLSGAKFPSVVRLLSDGHLLLGECYVHGAWPDELMDDKSLRRERFQFK